MSFQCYYEFSTGGGPVNHDGMGPCGQGDNPDNLQCCGVSEVCMSDGICACSKLDPGGSGYYIGGCTNPTMEDPQCPRNCTSFANSDVVYNYDTGKWLCCSGNETYSRNCSFIEWSQPAGNAPPPLELQYIATIIATGESLPLAPRIAVASTSSATSTDGSFSTRSPTTVTTYTATVTVSIPPDCSTSKGLSAGASAGITIAAMATFIIAIAIGFWDSSYHRKRRVPPIYTGTRLVQRPMSPVEKPTVFSPQLLPTTSHRVVASSSVSPHELSIEHMTI